MKSKITSFALCALLVTGACSKQETTTVAETKNGTTTATTVESTQQVSLTPEQLGELGAQIKKAPKDAQKLLEAHGLNEQTFEQAIRKVSEDPAAAKRYSVSYKKASA